MKPKNHPVIVGQVARDTEAWYQWLVQNNEQRRARGLPEFEPSYELAETLALRTREERSKGMTAKERQLIIEAIAAWERAISPHDPPALQRSCQRAAESLRLQLETGVPHCVDHLEPIDADGLCATERMRRAGR